MTDHAIHASRIKESSVLDPLGIGENYNIRIVIMSIIISIIAIVNATILNFQSC